MQENVEGSPVIVEAQIPEYRWGSRYSIYTGLPAVLGWNWHQRQQRPMLPGTLVERRRADVNTCYDTTDLSQAMDILTRYGVRYVYVGDYERLYYSAAGLAKFDQLANEGVLRARYDTYGVTIYEVLSYK